MVSACKPHSLLHFTGHINVVLPGQAQHDAVFVQGKPSSGVWCMRTMRASDALGVPPLGHVCIATNAHGVDEGFLQRVLQGCKPPSAAQQALFSAAQLTRAQRLALVRHRRDEPLPDGIMFDGQSFRNSLGGVLLQHPRQQQFVGDFLTHSTYLIAVSGDVNFLLID